MPPKRIRRTQARRRYNRRTIPTQGLKNFMRIRRTQGLGVYKLRATTQAVTGGGGMLLYRFSTSNPNAYLSVDGGAYANAVQDWSSVSALYDQYKVNAIKIVYTPHLPNDTSVTVFYRSVYVSIDYDSVTQPTTYDGIAQYERMRVVNLYRPFKLYFRLPAVLNTSSSTVVVGRMGWLDIANPNPAGCIQLFSEGLNLSSAYGRFTVTYYISCKNRR